MSNTLLSFIQENNLKDLCCKSNSSYTHFINNPLKLPCDNSVCSKCFKQLTKNDNVCYKCTFCSKSHKKDEFEESKFWKCLKLDFDSILKKFNEKLKKYEKELNDKFLNGENIVDTFIEFLKEDVMIHAEKIKMEVEKTYESFIEQLDTYKNEIKKELYELKDNYYKEHFVVEDEAFNVNRIDDEHVNNDNILEYLNKCQDYLDELRSYETQFHSIVSSIDFKPISHFSFSFGKLNRNKPLRIQNWKSDVTQSIKYNQIILIEGMCALKDEKFIISDSYSGNLFILNNNFQILSHLSEIEKFKFKHPCEIAYDNNDIIYVNDQGNRSIVLIDKNFKTLKGFINNIDACDIAIHNGMLFVIGEERRSIENKQRESYLKKYTRSGTFISKLFSIPVDSNHPFPLKLEVNSNIIAIMVVANGINLINIYDSNGNFKKTLDLINIENFLINDSSLFVLTNNLDIQLYNLKDSNIVYNNSFNASELVWKGGLLHTSMILFGEKFVLSNDFNGLLVFGSAKKIEV